jgi:hypothetical protein
MRARVEIEGAGFGPSFRALIAARLRRLSLAGRIERFEAGRIVLRVEGDPALVGMLEMACLLGPLDALVAAVRIEPG